MMARSEGRNNTLRFTFYFLRFTNDEQSVNQIDAPKAIKVTELQMDAPHSLEDYRKPPGDSFKKIKITEEQDMRTILLSDSLSKEINKVAREFGYTEEKQFIEDMLKEKILEYKRQMFLKGVANIRRKLATKGLTEDEIIADFERFRHSQSRSPAA